MVPYFVLNAFREAFTVTDIRYRQILYILRGSKQSTIKS